MQVDWMRWLVDLVHVIKPSRGNTLQCRSMLEMDHNVIQYGEKWFSSSQLRGDHHFPASMPWRSKLQCNLMQTIVRYRTISVQYVHSGTNDPDMSRDFFVSLWNADRKKPKPSGSRRPKVLKSGDQGATFLVRQALSGLLERSFSDASVLKGKPYGKVKLKQPPTSQSVSGILEPTSSEEVTGQRTLQDWPASLTRESFPCLLSKVAPLLARSNLLITRDIEWANLVLGFEQENRYAVVDVCYPQAPVGFIREQSNLIARQALRRRRPFIALITDGLGNELFRIRRPFWWITSSIYAEINGKEIGVVHQRWHLWRRVYDLYLGNKQFAVVDNPGFWNWTFTLKDIDGNVLAEIDRDWRGIGFEIFTDAGQYVIRFGSANSGVIPVPGIQELNVTRSLTLSERAVAVALAVSLDNDYFSRHGGWGFPIMSIDD